MQILDSPNVRVLVTLAIALSAIFAAGVLWYQGPQMWPFRTLLAFGWLAFAAVCTIVFLRRSSVRALTGYAFSFAVLAVWFVLISPSNDRQWSPEMVQTMSYTREGEKVTVANVRNFDWTGPASAVERWERRTYDLNTLESDVLSLYWKGPTIAHTYFSFVWTSGEALSISAEIRKEKNEAYSPIGGFFKAYELAILAGDERDFYGWRVFFPTEDIQLFRTTATPAQARALLLQLLDLANEVAIKPAFYNTITENCTTEVWMLTDTLGHGQPIDWRINASGHLPDFLYDLKVLDTSRPLAELRSKGRIMPAARAALDRDLAGAAFSKALREGIPPVVR